MELSATVSHPSQSVVSDPQRVQAVNFDDEEDWPDEWWHDWESDWMEDW